ncbi:MAG TPA: sugar ABC transporter ATP-binding protein [Xanthobacteraceae bacterium]|nr:sugar ABC transporter ATP-binding protein [Xanthobacteraceae bacterium]
MTQPAASAEGVSKRFGATVALDGVNFDVAFGEIHAVVGENGAGKSTLIRILGGVHRPDRGVVRVDGEQCDFASPRDAIAAGIVTIPQELRLVPALSVAENIALGDLPVRRFGPLAMVDGVRMREEAREVLAELDFAPDPGVPVALLGFAERQLVAIAKALRRRCRIFILDEPTAALEQREVARLFSVLARMKRQGTAVIYVSHRLDEVVAIADRCTVLRDGRVAAVAARGAFTANDLAAAMTARAAENAVTTSLPSGTPLLDARPDGVAPVRLRQGEIVGLAGLLGSGTDRMIRRLFGAAREPVMVEVGGNERRLASPRDAIAAGIGMVPGERSLGLVMNQTVRDNILLPNLNALSRMGYLDRDAGERIVTELMELVDVRPRKPDLKASALSGGNQQKVILAKWLARRVAVLLLNDPTQGIDVAAKAQIHALIRDVVARGGGALLYSSDLGELARLCDRVLAVRQGRVAATLERSAGIDEPKLRSAIGG